MLSIASSASLNRLLDHLTNDLMKAQQIDPLYTPWLIVQNKEIREWVQIGITDRLGVSANLRFLLPSELLWTTYRNLYPDTPEILAGDRIPLHWRILSFLKQAPVIKRLNKLGMPELKGGNQRFHLAGQLADVFDLYQNYRPNMLMGWRECKLSTSLPDEKWQAAIWKILVEDFDKPLHDRAEVWSDLLKRFNDETTAITGLPPHLFIFGLSHFSATFADLISAISAHISVNLYQKEIEDISGSNAARWKDLHDQWINLKKGSHQLFSDHTSMVQQDEAEVEAVYQQLQKNGWSGQELIIRSCHSPRREVEILKEQILSLLNHDPDLKPEDILVMVPDMDQYGQLLHSIFQFSDEEPYLPVAYPYVQDADEQRLLNTLLDIFTGTARVSDIISLIENPLVRKRFDLSDTDISMIRDWIHDQYIHHGLERTDSAYSFEKLTQTLMASYAMEGQIPDRFNGLPLDTVITGTDQLQLASRFSSLIHLLKDLRPEKNEQRKPIDWLETLQNWLSAFTESGEEDGPGILEKACSSTNVAAVDFTTDLQEIRSWIHMYLDQTQAASTGLGSGIVVSSYIPYRSVPFRFIAMLGLNESSFPRNPPRPAFDLIHNEPMAGERITRKDDELLFLETLNAAEETLYLSYNGQDLHKDEERLPSILLQRLLDVVAEEDRNLKKEKLHGFDRAYFKEGRSYSLYKRKLAEKVYQKGKKQPVFLSSMEYIVGEWVPPDGTIELNELIRFFSTPCKQFCKKLLKMDPGRDEEELSDREIFKPQGLDSYILNNLLMDQLEKKINPDELLDFTLIKGMIPDSIGGELGFSREYEKVTLLKEERDKLISGELSAIDKTISIGEIKIHGKLHTISGNRLVLWRNGKARAKDLVSAWFQHLFALCSTSDIEKTFLITFDSSKTKVTAFEKINEPKAILSDLIDWYMNVPTDNNLLCFFPESSKAYAIHDSMEEAMSSWEDDNRGEQDDFYNDRIWRGDDPLSKPEFKQLSTRFWQPVIDSVEDNI